MTEALAAAPQLATPTPSKRARRLPPLAFACTAFLSSFLLFMVEPLQGKMLLPLFGGAPAVWNTCMVFFQALLLLGYAYAHFIATRLTLRWQVVVHACVLTIPFAFLPLLLPDVIVKVEWFAAEPVKWLLIVLAMTSGPAFFVIAASSPLLQTWFHRSEVARGNAGQNANPYGLYAAGNAGSLLALIAYPTLVEPKLKLLQQSWTWSFGYGFLVLGFFALAVYVWRAGKEESRTARGNRVVAKAAKAARKMAAQDSDEDDLHFHLEANDPAMAESAAELYSSLAPRPEFGFDTLDAWEAREPAAAGKPAASLESIKILTWIALAFVPSSLMLGVTTYMTTDVASIPMLWILPLIIYVASFALVFWRYPRWLDRTLELAAPVAMSAVVFLIFVDFRRNLGVLIGLHLTAFAVATFWCHGRLARLKPAPEKLTAYYFWLSAGGVLGGLFNTMLAPQIFSGVAEYPLTAAATILAAAFAKRLLPELTAARTPKKKRRTTPRGGGLRELAMAMAAAAAGAVMLAVMVNLYHQDELSYIAHAVQDYLPRDLVPLCLVYAVPLAAVILAFSRRPMRLGAGILGIAILGLNQDMDVATLFRQRSFFGVLTVKQYHDPEIHSLVHGGILHGEQRLDDPEARLIPRSYYHPDGPLGQIMKEVHARREHPNIAAIGLGSGAIAAYGTKENEITFYELNPNVEKLARNPDLFTYVDDCLKRWCHLNIVIGDGRLKILEAQQAYDLIVVDAFSSDAIPVHLITLQATQAYLSKLSPGGVIAFHISNRYVDLEPVILNQAKELGLGYAVRSDAGDEDSGKGASVWAIVAATNDIFEPIVQDDRWRGLQNKDGVGIWTDDYASVLKALTWY